MLKLALHLNQYALNETKLLRLTCATLKQVRNNERDNRTGDNPADDLNNERLTESEAPSP